MSVKGFGIKLQFTTDSGTTWTDTGAVEDANPPASSKDTYETTHHGTPNGIKEFMGGLVDTGEASIDVQYDMANTGHIELRTRANTAHEAPQDYRFVWGDTGATIDEFSAICTNFAPQSPIDNKVLATISFKLSGAVDYDAGA